MKLSKTYVENIIFSTAYYILSITIEVVIPLLYGILLQVNNLQYLRKRQKYCKRKRNLKCILLLQILNNCFIFYYKTGIHHLTLRDTKIYR